MVEPDRHVDGVHGVDGELVGAGLNVEPHAVEHRFQMRALLLAQRPAKNPLPAFELLLDQFSESCDGPTHKAPRWGADGKAGF